MRQRIIGSILAWLLVASWSPCASTATFGVAIDVREVAEIAVTGNVTAPLTLDNPAVGGQEVSPATDSTTYLQYTSSVATGLHRTIQGALLAPLAAGLTLELQVQTPVGGIGTPGTSLGWQALSATNTDLLNGIGTCATGTGATDGARLQYRLSVNDYSQLTTDSSMPTVTFTLTEDN
jgi:hypothetical protein